MIGHNSAFSLTAVVVMAAVVSATLADTGFCLWCDKAMSQNFMSCVCSKIKNSPIFGKISPGAFEDMKNSMMAASLAITKSSDSMKMKMMTGAMAGEFAEFIRPLYLKGNSEVEMLVLMNIVGSCYATTTGQSHYSFTQDFRKTVDFMLSTEGKPSYDDSVSETNSAPLQYPAQASASSAALEGQNVMPPNYYYAPPVQPSFTMPVPNNFVPNQKYTPSPNISPYYPNTGLPDSVQLAGEQGEANVASLSYPPYKQDNAPDIRPGPNVQPQSTQTNAASNYYSFQPKKLSNFSPTTTVQQNSNAASSSTLFGANTLNVRTDQFLPQNKGPVSNAEPSYANNDQRNPPNFVNEHFNNADFRHVNNAQRNLPNLITVPVSNAAPSYAKNDQTNQPNFITGPAVQQSSSGATSGTEVFTLNYQSLGANPLNAGPNQFFPQDKGPVSKVAPTNANNDQRNLPNFVTNSGAQQPSSVATSRAEALALKDQSFPPYNSRNQIVQNSNSEGETLRQKGAYPLNYGNNSPTQSVQSTAGASSYNGPKSNYDYYDYNLNYPPQPSSYNNHQPYYDYNSNYPPQPSSYDYHKPYYDYGSKYPSQQISNNKSPPNYDNNSGNPKPDISPGTASRGDDSKSQLTNGKSGEVTNENNSSQSEDNDEVARAMKFAESIYVPIAGSGKFKCAFNKRTSNNKAASCIYKMVRGALKHCGYSKYAVEIASACSDEIKSLPEKCSFTAYGEAMSKSLMDQFYAKEMIGENPEDQARCITDAFLSRLKKRKSSQSSKSATSTVAPSTVAPYAESSSSPDDSTDTGYGQDSSDYSDYYDSTVTTDYSYQYHSDYSTSQTRANQQSTGKTDSATTDYNYQFYTSRTTDVPNDNSDQQYGDYFTSKPYSPNNQDPQNINQYYYGSYYDYAQEGKKSQGDYYYQYNGDYPTSQKNKRLKNQTPKEKNSQNGYYYQHYYDYPTSQTKARPIQRPPGENANLAQNARPNYNETPGSNKMHNNYSNERQKDISVASASASSSSVTNQGRENKAKNKKTKRRNRSNGKPVPKNGSNLGSSNAGENQGNSETDPQQYTSLATYDTTSLQPQQGQFPESTSSDDGGSFYPDTVLASSQSQTKPDDEKIEKMHRVIVLMKYALLSIANGKFNYKMYSNVISALAKFLQKDIHPEWGSQKCLIEILIESLIACTHLLAKVPPEYLNKITVPENIDTAVASWSANSSEQEGQNSNQTKEKNKAQNGQSYDAQRMTQQQNNWPMDSSRQGGQESQTTNKRNPAGNGRSYDVQQMPQQSNWNIRYSTQQGNSLPQ